MFNSWSRVWSTNAFSHSIIATSRAVTNSLSSGIVSRWESLSARASAASTPRSITHSAAWGRVRDDIARLRTWLVEAEALVDNFSPTESSAAASQDLHRLESGAKALREFLQQMEARKPVILAVQLTQHPELASGAPQIRTQVHELAERWRRVIQRGRGWQMALQGNFATSPDLRTQLQMLSSALREATEAVRECKLRAENGGMVANRIRIVEKDLQLTEDKATRWGEYVDVLYAPGLVSGSASASANAVPATATATATAELLSLRHRLREVAERTREQLRLCARLRSVAVTMVCLIEFSNL